MERAAAADALTVGRHVATDNPRLMHSDSGDFLSIIDRRKNGHIGITLAAAWAAYLAQLLKRT